MRNILFVLLALAAMGTGGWTVFRQLQSSPVSLTVGEEPEEITYICTETHTVSRGEWQTMPAVNPQTGRRTLVQALYCQQCGQWYPAPPPEMAQQSPRGPACPKDGATLGMEGPLVNAQASGGG